MKVCIRLFAEMSKRLFESKHHTQIYAKFRPTYGQKVYDKIINFYQETCNDFKLALDVGCGSGQGTKPLAKYFESVMGIDISEKQIEAASTNIANIKFQVGSADDLRFLGDNSTDLITIAQAIHWINTEGFYTEAERVLKPGGSIVVYGYGICNLDNKLAQDIFLKFYRETLNGYWDSNRKHIDNHLQEFTLPFAGWKRDDSLKMVEDWSVEEFVGYLSTWTGYRAYLKANPSTRVLDEMKSRFRELCADQDDGERKVHIEWPVFMLMGHKPSHRQ